MQAVEVYVKAVPDTTWYQLEKSFRTFDFETYLIAYVSSPSGVLDRLANQNCLLGEGYHRYVHSHGPPRQY